MGADRPPRTLNFTKHRGPIASRSVHRPRGAKIGRAAGLGALGLVSGSPGIVCGETWQMVTRARPQCGGSCRPEARTAPPPTPPSSSATFIHSHTVYLRDKPRYPLPRFSGCSVTVQAKRAFLHVLPSVITIQSATLL